MPSGPSISDFVKGKLLDQLGVTSETLHKIKFGRGAVGKISVLTVVTLVAIGGVALKLSTTLALLVAIGVLAIICLAALGAIVFVVRSRPEIAVLEGAELILYQQVTLGVKGQPALPSTSPVPETALFSPATGDESAPGGSQ